MAIIEIYSRTTEDPFFDAYKMDVTNELEALLGKIRMIMGTRKGDLLGDPNFGVDLEQYIFETSVDAGSIRREVESQFSRYIPEASRYNLSVTAGVVQNELKNNILVDVSINQEKVLGFVI